MAQEVEHPTFDQIDVRVDQATVNGHRLVLAHQMPIDADHLLKVAGRRQKQQPVRLLVDANQVALCAHKVREL